MDNENIKEILDYFRKYATIRENTMISEIEDYITNLQEKNNNLQEDFKRHIDRINELTERSDNLQEELKYQKQAEQEYNEKHTKLMNKYKNLQEKVNQYENPDDMTLFYMWLDEKSKDKIKKLQQENKKLEEDNYELQKYINEEEGFVKDENRELGLRIDKAIPKLKKLNKKLKDILKIGIDIKEISDIENILKGDDE